MVGRIIEAIGARKDGSEFPMEHSFAVWKTREGTFFTGIIRDITVRKQAEERAQQLAAMEERQHLARELHDSVSQALYGISLGAHTALVVRDRDPAKLTEALDYILAQADAGLTEMRALIFELRPESLETEGLVVALTRQATALQARHGISVEIKSSVEPDLPFEAKEALYRIAQEALHNAARHARANKVDLRLNYTAQEIVLEVADDGVGFDPTGLFVGHLGLRSMRERAMRQGGTLDIESAPGLGTRVRARIPVRAP